MAHRSHQPCFLRVAGDELRVRQQGDALLAHEDICRCHGAKLHRVCGEDACAPSLLIAIKGHEALVRQRALEVLRLEAQVSFDEYLDGRKLKLRYVAHARDVFANQPKVELRLCGMKKLKKEKESTLW
jgi:hypothetical protein